MERQEIDGALKRRLRECLGSGIMRQAAEYALFPGGKRLRPRLALFFGKGFGAPKKNLLTLTSAIEFIHNYTLIHDDLPAMDNDDMRRGKPTVHKKFGESCAILAGDALLTHAFELLGHLPNPAVSRLVASAVGAQGVIGGQALDIGLSRNGNKKTLSKNPRFFQHMYYLKTGKLFEASVLGAAMLSPKPLPGSTMRILRDWSREFGFCFQLADDLQDTTETRQKSVPTLAACWGANRSAKELAKHLQNLRSLTGLLPLPAASKNSLYQLLDEIFKN